MSVRGSNSRNNAGGVVTHQVLPNQHLFIVQSESSVILFWVFAAWRTAHQNDDYFNSKLQENLHSERLQRGM